MLSNDFLQSVGVLHVEVVHFEEVLSQVPRIGLQSGQDGSSLQPDVDVDQEVLVLEESALLLGHLSGTGRAGSLVLDLSLQGLHVGVLLGSTWILLGLVRREGVLVGLLVVLHLVSWHVVSLLSLLLLAILVEVVPLVAILHSLLLVLLGLDVSEFGVERSLFGNLGVVVPLELSLHGSGLVSFSDELLFDGAHGIERSVLLVGEVSRLLVKIRSVSLLLDGFLANLVEDLLALVLSDPIEPVLVEESVVSSDLLDLIRGEEKTALSMSSKGLLANLVRLRVLLALNIQNLLMVEVLNGSQLVLEIAERNLALAFSITTDSSPDLS